MPDRKRRTPEEIAAAMFGKPAKPTKPQTATQMLGEARSKNILNLATNPTHADSVMYDRLHPGGTSIFDKKDGKGSGTKKPYSEQIDEQIDTLNKKINAIDIRAEKKVKEFEQLPSGKYTPKFEQDKEGYDVDVYRKATKPDVVRAEAKQRTDYVKQVAWLQEAKRTGLKPEQLRKVIPEGKKLVEQLRETIPIDMSTESGKARFIEIVNEQLDKLYGIDLKTLIDLKDK